MPWLTLRPEMMGYLELGESQYDPTSSPSAGVERIALDYPLCSAKVRSSHLLSVDWKYDSGLLPVREYRRVQRG